MKLLSFAALLLASLPLFAQAAEPAPQSLHDYRDKNRVLLIFAPSASDVRYRKQSELLAGNDSGLKERDLLRFNLFESNSAALRKQYGVRPGQFRVLLIGKDGNTAYSAVRPVVPSDLFRRIDRMPMRRDEMRRRGR